MSVVSRSLFVPAATVVLTIVAAASSPVAVRAQSEAPVHAPPQHAGTEAIDHASSRDVGVMLAHLQQQLVRLTGVVEPRPGDIETLTRAMDAARARPVKAEQLKALSEALAAALGTGTFEEVTLQRLAEDLFAALNNRALSADQAALVAVDVSAALQDLGVQERRVAVVLTALQGVCPAAVPPPATPDATGTTPKTPAKRSLLTLSRDSSE